MKLGAVSSNHCGQPVTGEHPQPITTRVALAADFPSETRIVEVNHVRPDSEPANPSTRQFHVQPCAGFLPHGPGNRARNNGCVVFDPLPVATAGNVSFADHRLLLNFSPRRGASRQPRGFGLIQIKYPAHNSVRLHPAHGQRLSKQNFSVTQWQPRRGGRK